MGAGGALLMFAASKHWGWALQPHSPARQTASSAGGPFHSLGGFLGLALGS